MLLHVNDEACSAVRSRCPWQGSLCRGELSVPGSLVVMLQSCSSKGLVDEHKLVPATAGQAVPAACRTLTQSSNACKRAAVVSNSLHAEE
jgi:hypothetical protein